MAIIRKDNTVQAIERVLVTEDYASVIVHVWQNKKIVAVPYRTAKKSKIALINEYEHDPLKLKFIPKGKRK